MDIEETVWNILTEPLKGLGYNLIRVKMIGSKNCKLWLNVCLIKD